MADDSNGKPARPIPISVLATREKQNRIKRRAVGDRVKAPEAPGSSPDPVRAEDEGGDGGGTLEASRSARALLKILGEEFVRLREQNRTSAWAAYQRRIASNLDILVPNAIGLKEATGLLREIEEFMKNDAGASVATPSEVVRNWLNQDDSKEIVN